MTDKTNDIAETMRRASELIRNLTAKLEESIGQTTKAYETAEGFRGLLVTWARSRRDLDRMKREADATFVLSAEHAEAYLAMLAAQQTHDQLERRMIEAFGSDPDA